SGPCMLQGIGLERQIQIELRQLDVEIERGELQVQVEGLKFFLSLGHGFSRFRHAQIQIQIQIGLREPGPGKGRDGGSDQQTTFEYFHDFCPVVRKFDSITLTLNNSDSASIRCFNPRISSASIVSGVFAISSVKRSTSSRKGNMAVSPRFA